MTIDLHTEIAPAPAAAQFHDTRRTWMLDRIQAGRQGDVLRHVMAVYAQPLQAYVARSRYAWLGEPADLVHGFFAERLVQEGYLERWHENGRLLRDWLRIGLIYWVRELARREARARGVAPVPLALEGEEHEPHEVLRKSFALNITRLAMEEAAEACRLDGLELNWRAFYLHYYEGLSYRAVGLELGLDEVRAEVKARAPRKRFRNALRAHLERDGVAPENIARELEALMDDLRA